MYNPKVTVIGSNMIDLITYIERMPNIGETIEARGFSLGFGGKGANQAAAAALLGANVSMVSKVGGDLFGKATIDNLVKLGVNTANVKIEPEVTSGAAPIFVDTESNNRILISKGANEYLLPIDIDNAEYLIKESDIVLLQLEIPIETTFWAIDLCKKHDVKVILNPAPAISNLDFDVLGKVDFLIPNESELNTMTAMPVCSVDQIKEAALFLKHKGIENVIVTMGELGALICSDDICEVIPPYRVKAVDSTGAGDAFIGCFAVEYFRSSKIAEAVLLSNRYAALSATRPGTQKSYFSFAELTEMKR